MSAGSEIQDLLPKFNAAVRARRNGLAIRAERQRFDEVAIGRSERGIDQGACVLEGGNFVEIDVIATGAGGVLAVGGNGARVDWIESVGEILPAERRQRMDHTGGALGDPKLEEAKFIRRKWLGVGFVIFRGHQWFGLMRGGLEKQTFAWFARDDCGARFAAL